ncbi:MAG TPA: hypothetical protein VGJ51_03605, partial [Candidatus Angelobacter sp.]
MHLKRLWRSLVSVSPYLRGAVFIFVVVSSFMANAQSSRPLDGEPWDVGVWASGGFSVPGGTKDTHAIDAGVRLGKI